MPDGTDLLKDRFLVIRYSSFAAIFLAVLISLIYGGYAIVAVVGPLLLLGPTMEVVIWPVALARPAAPPATYRSWLVMSSDPPVMARLVPTAPDAP